MIHLVCNIDIYYLFISCSFIMKVKVAEKCGFCHGVENAISLAEKVLEVGTAV